MSTLWLDFLGAQVRFVNTPGFGRTRIGEAGESTKEPLIFLHGIGGHLEAYSKNLVPLSDRYRAIAYDYPNHGLSEKRPIEFNPYVLADHLRELMDELGIDRAHLCGESLGGWIAGVFQTVYPDRVRRLVLNTTAGLPIVTEKGKKELENLQNLSRKAAEQEPTQESVRNRLKWLMHAENADLVTDELVETRLFFYRHMQEVAASVFGLIRKHDDYLIPLEKIGCETLFLWTDHNPVHDVDTARAASQKVPGSLLYVMKAKSGHWPQYEAPEEFNEVVGRFLATGSV